MDLIKIFDNRHKDSNGAPQLIGVLNINNMIPVDKAVISAVDLRALESVLEKYLAKYEVYDYEEQIEDETEEEEFCMAMV